MKNRRKEGDNTCVLTVRIRRVYYTPLGGVGNQLFRVAILPPSLLPPEIPFLKRPNNEERPIPSFGLSPLSFLGLRFILRRAIFRNTDDPIALSL